ncbi:MAG: hypothetical protein J6E31_03705, partial [Pyramidobacter sp.]|nr:hypothetical protein [Pyramidobacter sp.]
MSHNVSLCNLFDRVQVTGVCFLLQGCASLLQFSNTLFSNAFFRVFQVGRRHRLSDAQRSAAYRHFRGVVLAVQHDGLGAFDAIDNDIGSDALAAVVHLAVVGSRVLQEFVKDSVDIAGFKLPGERIKFIRGCGFKIANEALAATAELKRGSQRFQCIYLFLHLRAHFPVNVLFQFFQEQRSGICELSSDRMPVKIDGILNEFFGHGL